MIDQGKIIEAEKEIGNLLGKDKFKGNILLSRIRRIQGRYEESQEIIDPLLTSKNIDEDTHIVALIEMAVSLWHEHKLTRIEKPHLKALEYLQQGLAILEQKNSSLRNKKLKASLLYIKGYVHHALKAWYGFDPISDDKYEGDTTLSPDEINQQLIDEFEELNGLDHRGPQMFRFINELPIDKRLPIRKRFRYLWDQNKQIDKQPNYRKKTMHHKRLSMDSFKQALEIRKSISDRPDILISLVNAYMFDYYYSGGIYRSFNKYDYITRVDEPNQEEPNTAYNHILNCMKSPTSISMMRIGAIALMPLVYHKSINRSWWNVFEVELKHGFKTDEYIQQLISDAGNKRDKIMLTGELSDKIRFLTSKDPELRNPCNRYWMPFILRNAAMEMRAKRKYEQSMMLYLEALVLLENHYEYWEKNILIIELQSLKEPWDHEIPPKILDLVIDSISQFDQLIDSESIIKKVKSINRLYAEVGSLDYPNFDNLDETTREIYRSISKIGKVYRAFNLVALLGDPVQQFRYLNELVKHIDREDTGLGDLAMYMHKLYRNVKTSSLEYLNQYFDTIDNYN
jgi:hypothetical protein